MTLNAKDAVLQELKKTIDDLLHKPEIQDKILWKIDNEALLGSKDAWIYKLEKTLTEIKEIVTNFYETGFLHTDNDCILINNHLCVETLDKILQKISECEVCSDK